MLLALCSVAQSLYARRVVNSSAHLSLDSHQEFEFLVLKHTWPAILHTRNLYYFFMLLHHQKKTTNYFTMSCFALVVVPTARMDQNVWEWWWMIAIKNKKRGAWWLEYLFACNRSDVCEQRDRMRAGRDISAHCTCARTVMIHRDARDAASTSKYRLNYSTFHPPHFVVSKCNNFKINAFIHILYSVQVSSSE